MNMHSFEAKGASFDHSHGMVCDIAPKFGHLCILAWKTMSCNRYFHLFLKNIIFHEVEKQQFLKEVQLVVAKSATTRFFTQTRSYLRDDVQIL